MTPKEKAEQLVKKYLPNFIEQYDNHGFDDYDFNEDRAKQCALIAVDEIVKSKSLKYLFTEKQIYSMEETSDDRWIYDTFMEYWEEVKQEINTL